MKEVLKEVYRSVLIQIAEDLSVEQCKELLFYCKDYVPGKYLSICSIAPISIVQIFQCLENVQRISWEDLSYLEPFMHAIRREDLVSKLTAFKITKELMFYAWKRQGSVPSVNASASSSGHYLAEMMDLHQDRTDVGGLLFSLLQSGQNANSILDAVAKALLGDDAGTTGNCSWPSTFALLVAIAAEIVSVVSKVEVRDHHNKYAVKLAIELGNNLSLKLARLGSWVSEL